LFLLGVIATEAKSNCRDAGRYFSMLATPDERRLNNK
jgi:hypothetical protein